jgi:hypothetical protein
VGVRQTSGTSIEVLRELFHTRPSYTPFVHTLHIYTLHGVGLKNEYLNFMVSDFVKKPGKSLHISVKRRFIMKYKNQIPANKSNYWHRSNKNWVAARRPM